MTASRLRFLSNTAHKAHTLDVCPSIAGPRPDSVALYRMVQGQRI